MKWFRKFLSDQRGEINAAAMIISIVMFTVALLMFPIVIDASDDILGHASIASYTGLANLVALGPMLLLIGIVFGGGVLGWMGLGKPGFSRRSKKSGLR